MNFAACSLFFAFFLPVTTQAAITVKISPTETIEVRANDSRDKEISLDFLKNGSVLQTERSLGDRFISLKHKGTNSFVHSFDLDNDGIAEVFVRLAMVPMGIVRVFKWNATTGKFERMKFGAKKESGLPVALVKKVTLTSLGNLEYMGGSKKKPRKMVLLRQGKDYKLPY